MCEKIYASDWIFHEKNDLYTRTFISPEESCVYCITRINIPEFGDTFSISILNPFIIENQYKLINSEVYDSLEKAKEEAENHYKTFKGITNEQLIHHEKNSNK